MNEPWKNRKYLDLLAQHALVLDGAMGTVIYEKGIFVNACYENLCLSNPALIEEIHREYVTAGADVILTNTYGANLIKLRQFGLADSFEAINRAGVALARKAIGDAEVLIAADIGPCLEQGETLSASNTAEIAAAFEAQCAVLADAGADLIFLETFSDASELLLAARAARATGLPVHASLTIGERGETSTGLAITDLMPRLDANPDIDTLGLNCSIGPAGLLRSVQSILPLIRKPFLVKPNAGRPQAVSGRQIYMANPEYFTEKAKEFIRLGCRGVGGCCGSTPAHIHSIANALHCLSEYKTASAVEIISAPGGESPAATPLRDPTTAAEKCAFGEKLATGKFVKSIEMLPPPSPDMSAMIAKARECQAAGIDALNIPDGPRATSRISPLVTAILLKQAGLTIEPIPHYCCRDRNLLGMQSDVLAAAAADIHNILVITGDAPKAGPGQEVRGVFDIDAIGLTSLIHKLNCGFDLAMKPVSPASRVLIGVGANPCFMNLDHEVDRFCQKIEAGADYAVTQPVFDPDALLRFLELAERAPRKIPIIAGIYPLANFRNASFMRNEVPGVVIPDATMERMAACKTKEEARSVGITLAREVIEKVRGAVAGIEVSAPFGNVQTALAVLA